MRPYRFPAELPDDAARYLASIRRLEQPIDLVDSIMAEVEATPQVVHWWPRLALAAAAAAVVVIALVLVLRLDAPDVGPARTPVPIDELPTAGTVLNRISIESDDEPVGLAAQLVWLANARTGELVQVEPETGAIATSPIVVTELRDAPSLPVAVLSSSVWVYDNATRELVELDPASNEERRRIGVDIVVDAIAADQAAIWLISATEDTLVRVDADTGALGPEIEVTDPTALAVEDGVVWVAHDSRTLSRFDGVTGAIQAETDIGVAAGQLLRTGNDVLVVPRDRGVLVRASSGGVTPDTGVVVQSVAVQAGTGTVWATLASGHIVRLGRDLHPEAAVATGSGIARGLVFGAGSLWTASGDALGDTYLFQVAPAR